MSRKSVAAGHGVTLPKTYTAHEVAAALSWHPETVRDACRQGRIHGVHVGRCWRVSQEELNRIVKNGIPASTDQSLAPASTGEAPQISPNSCRVGEKSKTATRNNKGNQNMNAHTIITHTVDALRNASVPAHRGDGRPNEIVKQDQPTSAWDSYIHEFELLRPLVAPDGTLVTLQSKDQQGRITCVPGLLLFSERNTAYIHAFGVSAAKGNVARSPSPMGTR